MHYLVQKKGAMTLSFLKNSKMYGFSKKSEAVKKVHDNTLAELFYYNGHRCPR